MLRASVGLDNLTILLPMISTVTELDLAMTFIMQAMNELLEEGLEASFNRHAAVARFCRRRLVEMGVDLFPAAGAIPSPTVTAAMIPHGFSWETWDRRLREQGLVVAGSYGPLAEKVFRLGHMGVQADMGLMERALDAIAGAL